MAAASGSAAKTERLLNLVIVLLYTRRPLTKAQLRAMVPQYAQVASDEAFDRMFERDKDDVREIGIPLAVEELSSLWEDEVGYRVHQRDYALPDVQFEADELAALGVAARAWAQASLAGPAAQALRKLRAADVERDEESLIGIEPRLRTPEPAFEALKDAVLRRQPVTFDYRRADSDESTRRQVQPWSVLSWHGHWYLTGFDTDRDAERVFRLSRIEGAVAPRGRPGTYAVPPDHDPRAALARRGLDTTPSPAVLRVRTGRGLALRRRARSVGEIDDQWSLIDIDHHDIEEFASEIAAYAGDVAVEQPIELQRAVVARLRGALSAHEGESA